jgi:hypothetical protein
VRGGAVAGSPRSDGRVYVGVNGRRYIRSRLIWLHVHGQFPAGNLGHRDRNRANDRLENLQECSLGENNRNRVYPVGSIIRSLRAIAAALACWAMSEPIRAGPASAASHSTMLQFKP